MFNKLTAQHEIRKRSNQLWNGLRREDRSWSGGCNRLIAQVLLFLTLLLTGTAVPAQDNWYSGFTSQWGSFGELYAQELAGVAWSGPNMILKDGGPVSYCTPSVENATCSGDGYCDQNANGTVMAWCWGIVENTCNPGYVWEDATHSCNAGFYLNASPPPDQGCDCSNAPGKAVAGDPIDIGSGNENEQEVDYVSADGRLRLTRSFNSASALVGSLGWNWQHNYEGRRIVPVEQALPLYPPLPDDMSSVYSDPASACNAGWNDIVAQDPRFSGYTVSGYNSSTQICSVSNGTQTLPFQVLNSNLAVGYSSGAGYAGVDVERPDGSIYPFYCSAGTCTSSPDVSLTLTASPTGYTLTDQDNTVEQYNPNGVLLSITARDGYVQTMTPTANGQLGMVTDSFGRSLSFNYDSATGQHLLSVATPDGLVQYGYNPSNTSVTSVTYPDSSERLYQYTNTTYATGLTGIVDENNVSLSSPPLYISISYDSNGRANQSGFNGGVGALSVSYSNPQDPVVTDALGVQRTYNFTTLNAKQKLTSITPVTTPCNACNSPQAETFDTAGYYASQTDWNGNLTNYTYDDTRGLELLRTEGLTSSGGTTASTRTITTQWEPSFNEQHLVSEYSGGSSGGVPSGTLLRTTEYDHDNSGNLTQKTVTDHTATPNQTRSWQYQNYTSWGTPQTIIGPRTDVADTWSILYYPLSGTCTSSSCANGQIDTVTDPLGHVTTYTSYDGSGRVLAMMDANGVQTTYSYYPRGWIKSVNAGSNQTGGGRVTNYKYWPTGQMQEIDYPSGAVRSFFYNNAHQLTDVYDLPVGSGGTVPGGADHIHYSVDVMNNVTGITVSDSTGTPVQIHTTDYNNLNQLWHDYGANPSTETTTYTTYNDGELKSITDPLGHVTNFTLDALNRVNAIIDPNQNSSTLASQATTQYGRNALNQLTSVTDPRGLITSYAINGLDEVSQIASPDTKTTQQTTFDGDGNVTTRIDANGKKTFYQYDALDRLTLLTRNDGTYVTLSYDQSDHCGLTSNKGAVHGCGIGHLTKVVDTESSSTLNFTYDPWGQIITRIETVSGVNLKTIWSYDASTGHLTGLVMPSGATVGYGWGSGITGGLVTGLNLNSSALLSNIAYFPFGGPTQWTLQQESGSPVDSRDYDQDGRIESDPVETIGYDHASRVTGWTLASGSTGNVSFGYQDPMDWVSSYTAGSASQALQYDGNGNRTQATLNGVKTTYTVDPASNRLNSTKKGTTTTSYSYDSDGSRTATGSTLWGYDTSERLVSANGGSYQYDGLGERVYKKLSAITLFNYDNNSQLIGEYRSTGASVEETLYLGSMPVATLLAGSGTGGTLYYIHADYRNTPRQIDNLSAQPVWAWTPTPFGENQPNQNPSGLGTFTYNLRYPGQYYDSESGFNYNYFRDYDSVTGRYIESDPIGLGGGTNTYAYVQGNPLSFIDPLGLFQHYGPYGGSPSGDPSTLSQLEQQANVYSSQAAQDAPAVGTQGAIALATLVAPEVVPGAVGAMCRAATPKNTRSIITAIRMFERLYGSPETVDALHEFSAETAEQRLLPGGSANPVIYPPASPPPIGGP